MFSLVSNLWRPLAPSSSSRVGDAIKIEHHTEPQDIPEQVAQTPSHHVKQLVDELTDKNPFREGQTRGSVVFALAKIVNPHSHHVATLERCRDVFTALTGLVGHMNANDHWVHIPCFISEKPGANSFSNQRLMRYALAIAQSHLNQLQRQQSKSSVS